MAIGLYIRLGISESPAFEQVKAEGRTIERPIAVVVRQHWPTVLLSMGAKLVDGSTSYLMKVFLLSFAVKTYGIPSTVMLNAIMAASIVQLVAIPGFAALGDRFGRQPVYVFGALLVAAFAFPTFWLVETRDPTLATLGVCMTLGVAWSAMYGPQAAMFPELFPPELRYTGASLGYQLSSVIGGGVSPVVAAGLVAWSSGAAWPVATYMMALATVSIACLGLLKRRSGMLAKDRAISPALQPG